MAMLHPGVTKPAPGVMHTSPATAPTEAPTLLDLPFLRYDANAPMRSTSRMSACKNKLLDCCTKHTKPSIYTSISISISVYITHYNSHSEVCVYYTVAPIIHVTKLQQTLQDQPRQHRGRGCHKGRRHSTGRDAIGDAQGRATVEAQPAEPKKASSLG